MKSVYVRGSGDNEPQQVGGPIFNGFTFGGYFQAIGPDPVIDLAKYPGLRAVKWRGEFTLTEGSSGPFVLSTAVAFGSRVGASQYLTASGTFTKASTPGLEAIEVECVGPGGDGGGAGTTAAGQGSSGGGGGGGGYAKKRILAADLPASQAYVLGSDTTFGSVIANGGVDGSLSTAFALPGHGAPGGAGGGASGGDINLNGSSGRRGDALAGAIGGSGGGPVFWGPPETYNPSTNTNGLAGKNYGNGGSGGANNASQGTARVGGVGAPGLIVLTPFLFALDPWAELWY